MTNDGPFEHGELRRITGRFALWNGIGIGWMVSRKDGLAI
jgi:hypothetical protein